MKKNRKFDDTKAILSLNIILRSIVITILMTPIMASAGSTADLALAKSAPQELIATGSQFNYNFNILNFGPDAAIDVVLEDPIPNGLNFVSCTATFGGTCEMTAFGFRADFDTLPVTGPPGAEITLTVGVDESASSGSQIVNTATVISSSKDNDPQSNTASASIVVEAGAEPITYYLHGTDVPGTAGGFTMDENPHSPPQPLQLNLANAPTWYSEPMLDGTFASGDFVLSFPCSLGLSLATTYALHRTAPDSSNPELISSLTQPLQICTGMQTITVPAGSAEEFDNERLRLRISTLLGLSITVDLGEDVKLVTPEFEEADDADPI